MSVKLTPGPWRVADYMARAEMIEGPNGEQLAMRQDDASVADMLVMAAARELLEALRQCVEHMEWSTLDGKRAHAAACAAIAKATGEQP